jgi:hypothetical protein
MIGDISLSRVLKFVPVLLLFGFFRSFPDILKRNSY